MDKKDIYFVTCGRSAPADQGVLTEETGPIYALRCKKLIPDKPPMVICGLGNRHHTTALLLEYTVDRFSVLAGIAETLETHSNRNNVILGPGNYLIRGPNSEYVKAGNTTNLWSDLEHCIDRAFIRQFLQFLSHNAIVCCDMELVRIICREIDKFPGKIRPATGYVVSIDSGGHIDICELTNSQPAT